MEIVCGMHQELLGMKAFATGGEAWPGLKCGWMGVLGKFYTESRVRDFGVYRFTPEELKAEYSGANIKKRGREE